MISSAMNLKLNKNLGAVKFEIVNYYVEWIKLLKFKFTLNIKLEGEEFVKETIAFIVSFNFII